MENKQFYCTPACMRELEKASAQSGVDHYRLMENAGAAAAVFIMRKINERNLTGSIAVICGKGNNGGDGFVIARNLSEIGINVYCIMTADNAGTELASKELSELMACGTVPVIMFSTNKDDVFDILEDSAIIADAVFGTGFHGEMPDDIAELLTFANQCSAVRIAIDIPSGGNGSSGAVAKGTFKADYTVTFGLEKIGTALHPLKEQCGKLTVADIGIPSGCIKTMPGLIYPVTYDMVRDAVPTRPYYSHKGMFGTVLNVAGCESMPGAAALSTKAALRSGAGLVKLASVKNVVRSLSSDLYECTYLPLSASDDGAISASNAALVAAEAGKASVTAIGCGLSVTENTKKVVKTLINTTEKPLIIDADGLNCIASDIDIIKDAKSSILVTPHPGELARLLGVSTDEITADRLSAAVRFNSLYETLIIAKGSPTFIVSEEKCYVSFTGNGGLSKGGSGDVLTGIIAGLAAMGIPLREAAAYGAFLHGYAADKAAEKYSQTGMLPSDVIAELPFVFKEMNR